jgi:hypothetical protein
MTTPREPFAEQLWVKNVSRTAMLVVPVVLSLGAFVGTRYLDGIAHDIASLVQSDIENGKHLTKIDEQVTTLQRSVTDLSVRSYSPADAGRDAALQAERNMNQDRRLDADEKRIDGIDSRVQRLETR